MNYQDLANFSIILNLIDERPELIENLPYIPADIAIIALPDILWKEDTNKNYVDYVNTRASGAPRIINAIKTHQKPIPEHVVAKYKSIVYEILRRRNHNYNHDLQAAVLVNFPNNVELYETVAEELGLNLAERIAELCEVFTDNAEALKSLPSLKNKTAAFISLFAGSKGQKFVNQRAVREKLLIEDRETNGEKARQYEY